MNKLNSHEALRSFREACEQALRCERTKILICGGTGCVAGGSL